MHLFDATSGKELPRPPLAVARWAVGIGMKPGWAGGLFVELPQSPGDVYTWT